MSDTGIGIEPALQQQIFEPFTQGDASASKRYQGPGSASLSRASRVEMMGGEIGLDTRRATAAPLVRAALCRPRSRHLRRPVRPGAMRARCCACSRATTVMPLLPIP
ncbi:MAG: hypothetical protein IPN11_16470 [Opitutaceae bacterium]|nr:hypothetical protein [Opitutaceae bacterium]